MSTLLEIPPAEAKKVSFVKSNVSESHIHSQSASDSRFKASRLCILAHKTMFCSGLCACLGCASYEALMMSMVTSMTSSAIKVIKEEVVCSLPCVSTTVTVNSYVT